MHRDSAPSRKLADRVTRAVGAIVLGLLAVASGHGVVSGVSRLLGLRTVWWAALLVLFTLGIVVVAVLATRAHWRWGRTRPLWQHHVLLGVILLLTLVMEWLD